ncbi:MAG: DUF72 domain-containing protein [Candidatus Lokiarchaeota archaeon]|nr:DUF72 domain-containing protein [Candidatus Lokiarchaeota archaeon]
MLKTGCVYLPKVTRAPIKEYPKHFQIAELGNIFYRFISEKEISKLSKLIKKFKDFELILRMNRLITHKYQFLNSNLPK